MRVSIILFRGSKPATDKYVLGALGQFERFDELYSVKQKYPQVKLLNAVD